MKKLEFDFNNQKFSTSLPDEAAQSVWAEIFKEREYKAAESIISLAKDPIIDVGAHVGLFAIYAKSFNPEVTIYSLEPELNNFKILQENIKKNNLTKIKNLQISLGGSSEQSSLIVTNDSHNHRLITAPSYNLQESEETTVQPVQVYSLRDFLDKEKISQVSLLKMDIEGGEYEVFSACLPADFARINAIVMEYHNYSGLNYKVIETQLRENGFGVQVFPSKFDKKMGFIFAKNKRI